MIAIVQLIAIALHFEVSEHLTVVDSALGVLRASMDQQSSITHVHSTVRLSND